MLTRVPRLIPAAQATTTECVSERTPDAEPPERPVDCSLGVLPRPLSERRNPPPDARSSRPAVTPIPPVDCLAKTAQAEVVEQALRTGTTCVRSEQNCCETEPDWSAGLTASARSAMTTWDQKGQPVQSLPGSPAGAERASPCCLRHDCRSWSRCGRSASNGGSNPTDHEAHH